MENDNKIDGGGHNQNADGQDDSHNTNIDPEVLGYLQQMETRLSKQMDGAVKRVTGKTADNDLLNQQVTIDGEDSTVAELVDFKRQSTQREADLAKREKLQNLKNRLAKRGVMDSVLELTAKLLVNEDLGEDGGSAFLDKFCQDHPSFVKGQIKSGSNSGGGVLPGFQTDKTETKKIDDQKLQNLASGQLT